MKQYNTDKSEHGFIDVYERKQTKPLNLIWQTFNGDQTNFEFEYTTEVLFKNIEHNKIFDDGQLSTRN